MSSQEWLPGRGAMSVPPLYRLWVAREAERAEPVVAGHYRSRIVRRIVRMTPVTGWM